MMNKRPRGRPKGSTINDARHLDAIADLLVREPELKKTPAISRVVQKVFPQQKWEAVERRLLRKWNETGEDRLTEARERRCEARKHSSIAAMSAASTSLAAQMNAIHARLEPLASAAKLMQGRIYPSLALYQKRAEQMQRIQDMFDRPELRRIRENVEMAGRALGRYNFDQMK